MIYQENKQWQGSIILSTLLHIILISIFFFGMPSVFDRLPEEKDVIIFEILPVSDIVNVNNESKTKQKEKIAEKSRLIENRQVEHKQEEQEQDKPLLENKIEKKIVEEVIKKKKTPIEKKQVKPQKKKKVAAKKKADNSLDSVFKNLEEESEGIDTKTSTRSSSSQKAGDKNSKSDKYDENLALSVTEKASIQQQIERYWNKPAIIHNIDKFNIRIHLNLKEDGTLKDSLAEVIEVISCPVNEEYACTLAADSARRAVHSAIPFQGLPAKRYNIWRTHTLMFESR